MHLDRISALELILTAGCNLRCSYCYQTDKQERSMEWSTLRSAADRLLASSAREVPGLFIGGAVGYGVAFFLPRQQLAPAKTSLSIGPGSVSMSGAF